MRFPRLWAVMLAFTVLGVPIGWALRDRPAATQAAATSTAHWSDSAYAGYGTDGSSFAFGAGSGVTLTNTSMKFAKSVGRTTLAGKTYETARWTSPWVTPAFAFEQVIPSWVATTPSGAIVQIRLQVRSATATSSYDTLGTWTTRDAEYARTSSGSQRDDLANVATDTLRANSGSLTQWRIRVLLLRRPGTVGPTVTSLGAVATSLSTNLPRTSKPYYRTGTTLAVPKYSQMIHRGEYPKYGGGGEAWCSPTSTAMILGYYGRLPAKKNYAWVNPKYADPWVDHVARMTFDNGYDGTGNWPFNTSLAAVYAGHGFVTRLDNLRDAERFIRAGIPLAVSISFARGGLGGAPISATSGHLVVISGFTNAGDPIVNDPAASANSGVRRTYDRGQFERAWLTKSGGATYVIRDGAHPLPKAPKGRTNW